MPYPTPPLPSQAPAAPLQIRPHNAAIACTGGPPCMPGSEADLHAGTLRHASPCTGRIDTTQLDNFPAIRPPVAWLSSGVKSE